MKRLRSRMRIDDKGNLEILDPGFESVRLLKSLDPSFRLQTKALPGFKSPRFLRLRNLSCGLMEDELESASEENLWACHEAAIYNSFKSCCEPEEASVLDLKIAIARRLIEACRLCARNCGVNRLRNKRGLCGLGKEAIIAEHYVHIAEEPAINPSHVLSLYGCGLRCHFCQQSVLLGDVPRDAQALTRSSFACFRLSGARSFSFLGGNPDESLYGILLFLRGLPSDWRLPLVWNSNAYGSRLATMLLVGVMDAFVPDLKFFSDSCAAAIADAPDYPAVAREAISGMLKQGVPVIVRILVLPGHNVCCHLPALDFLAEINRENLFLSVRDQYYPDGWITEQDGRLSRRVRREEAEEVVHRALALGLNLA